ncbi:unnamed protein product [Pleuronectes platessa]|uniref:Uncharacterized protein n=1 Tax=Pleuronectes platessa TaxID=8262 RepID=A0A9N7VKP3_PLEPL|nr:unnamed protein product [Pleuronectes platessa]
MSSDTKPVDKTLQWTAWWPCLNLSTHLQAQRNVPCLKPAALERIMNNNYVSTRMYFITLQLALQGQKDMLCSDPQTHMVPSSLIPQPPTISAATWESNTAQSVKDELSGADKMDVELSLIASEPEDCS